MDWPTMAAIGVLVGRWLGGGFSAVNPSGSLRAFHDKAVEVAIGLGTFFIFLLSSVNYQIFRAYPWVIYGFTLIALLSVFVIGHRIHGAKSWIVFGPLSIEPVEIARIGFIVTIAGLLDQPEREMRVSSKVCRTSLFLAASI